MILVWVSVGVVLASRLHICRLFIEAGKRVALDPFDQSTLEPFARSGMSDILVIAGALVLSTTQSIDATFRYQNYAYTLAIAIPAALLLLMLPMLSIHTRIRAFKKAELDTLNQRIRKASIALDSESMGLLEILLRRRDRIREISNWPLNVSMISRMIIYGVISPIAWVAAALVEQLVEDLLGG